jgi:predicted alpha/beta superfamily hydrolase
MVGRTQLGLLGVLVASSLLAAFPAGSRAAAVTFMVRVPATTPADARVFISGNIDALGPWNAAGMELGELGDGLYAITLQLPDAFDFEYKFTRGTWETVEKGSGFEEIENRTLDRASDATVSVEVANWRDQGGERRGASTVTGDLRVHEDLVSAALGGRRTVHVFLPPGYESAPAARYPVLYMHDGQNLFDAGTAFIGVEWRVDETVTRLVESGQIEPIIVVGVSNAGDRRMDEYTPVADAERGGGGGRRYADFLVQELKPFIDSTYRTLPDAEHTGIMGSSLGGLISLFTAWTYPGVFSRVGAMSTSYGWADGQIIDFISAEPAPRGVRVWIDMGTAEDRDDSDGDGVPDIIALHRRMRDVLVSKGLEPGRTLEYVEDEGARHDERAWAARLPAALRFLFPPESK